MASNTPEMNVVPAEAYTGEDFVPDEIPEQLKDECLVNYFRRRYAERPRLQAEYEKPAEPGKRDQRGRIDREITRIRKLREGFETTKRNEPDIERTGRLCDIEPRVAKLVASKKIESKEHGDRRIRIEKNILRAVSSWTMPHEPPLPKILEDAKKAGADAAALIKDPLTHLIEKVTNRFKPKEEIIVKPKLERQATVDTSRDFKLPEDSYGISVHKLTLRQPDTCPSSYMSYDTDRYPLKEVLLAGNRNPLTKACEPNTIRYFHFPANNMHWIEEAIARYHDEPTPGEFNYRQHDNYCKNSSNLLCRQFWTSLQHGGVYDPVHARHMRSHCSLITPGKLQFLGQGWSLTQKDTASTSEPITGSKNFVIFMPYLHWETHRRRKKMTDIMKEVTDEYHRDRPHVTESLREELAKSAEELYLKHARQLTYFLSSDDLAKQKVNPPKTMGDKKRGTLGDYLLQIAKIYDALDIEPDVRILRDHLHKNPPLHARRTLDQSYYWKLQNTDGRDEDQVVYRETKRGRNISRTSRIIMVDQLWLYILDDSKLLKLLIQRDANLSDTIISSFPRRWGRNKPDWSGVHKGIRARLDHLREGEIQSVYDMALLIMNQCSTVFFDRTKPVDERPEILDIFSNALSHVSGMKCISFESFWRQLNKLSSSDHHQADFEATARKYLNINPDESEGEGREEEDDRNEDVGCYGMMRQMFEERFRVGNNKDAVPSTTAANGMATQLNGSSPATVAALDPIMSNEQAAGTKLQNPDNLNTADGAAHSSYQSSDSFDKSSVPESTIQLAQDVSHEISSRLAELQKLEHSTVYVSEQLKDLLGLKQQQASIIEAKYALKRADESVTQGRSIMLFTIVTIVFLPLSFMSSVFGMNAKDFADKDGNPNMSLSHIFKLLFPISLGVIIISLTLAFGTLIRSPFYFIGTVSWALIYEYSYARYIWHTCQRNAGNLIRQKEWPKGHQSDGLNGWKIEAVSWIYGRKERAKLKKEWDKAKEMDRMRIESENSGATGRTVSRAGRGKSLSDGTASGIRTEIEKKISSTAGSSTGLPFDSADESHTGSANEKRRRLRPWSDGEDIPLRSLV
ncbi:uncharacterized protein RSE6_01413 [Rhynchosporium secalis]|uniref:Ankyrin repeat protein n=1 Tax=Rhynchosporium secalis TaxID=38038 RepID=A0A1E1LXR0_RHYSE|nr:uncharacterized protein RSE6_01413 [Rhynchosporium secalis]